MNKQSKKPKLITWFKEGARLNIAYAHWKVGQSYLLGREPEKNRSKAIYHLKKAAASKCPLGTRSYAEMIKTTDISKSGNLSYERCLEISSKQGNSTSQTLLAKHYHENNNIEDAKNWYEMSYLNGVQSSGSFKALLDSFGVIEGVSPCEAVNHLVDQMEEGCSESAYNLAMMRLSEYGSDTGPRPKFAMECLRKAVGLKHPKAHGVLASLLIKGEYENDDLFSILSSGVMLEDSYSMILMAEYYAKNDELKVSDKEVLALLEAAYKLNDPRSAVALSIYYEKHSELKSLDEVKEILFKVAKRGYFPAYFRLAELYQAYGYDEHDTKALAIFKICVTQSQSIGYDMLVAHYRRLRDKDSRYQTHVNFWLAAGCDDFYEFFLTELALELKKDRSKQSFLAESISYLTYLADVMEYIPAMNFLGLELDHGDGMINNPKKAAQYFEKAARLGDEHAANNLSIMYEYGRGVDENAYWDTYWTMQSIQKSDEAKSNRNESSLLIAENETYSKNCKVIEFKKRDKKGGNNGKAI